jgi:two-component sensor histidine kinase
VLIFFKNTFIATKCILLLLLITAVSFNISAQEIEFTELEKEWIKNHPTIYHGYEANWAPYEIYKDGKYSGIVGDYVKILEREIGISIQPIPNITWDETVKGLKSGEIDFTVCAGITKKRKQYLNFTKPYISSPLVIITRKNGDFVGGLTDLKGKTITLPNNYYTSELISADYPEIIIDFKEGIEASIKAVSLGEADAFVGNLVVASYYIEHEGYSNLKIAAPTDYEQSQVGLAARKDWPELISISQKVFDNISLKEKNEILQKWISVRYEYGLDVSKMKWYMLYGGMIALALILIFLSWNKSLKKEISKRIIIEKDLENALIEVNKTSEERKVLLQEIHHRVKNNLQIIVSILRLQNNEDDEVLSRKLNETITRINAISLVHEKIYLSDNLARINLKQYMTTLANDVVRSISLDRNPEIVIESNIGEVALKPMIPIALILNELITNSLKYGLANIENGVIRISINRLKDVVIMDYSDNGKWVEPVANSTGFGHSLIDVFTEQLDGSYERNIEFGTQYNFRFNDFFY